MASDSLSLSGKIAIVTGSGRENGIGAAIASTLARNGAAVVINHVSEASAPRAEAVAQKIREDGGRAIVIKADVGTPEGAKSLVEATLKGFESDRVDILGKWNNSNVEKKDESFPF
jgi:NAD(P)-dependent dehydrogenase (short-subunit alcohol dehydrogenase family)